MKILINYLLCVIVVAGVTSCGANGNTNNGTQTEKQVKTIHLTKAEFVKKVVNYEENAKEWNYLGDKPAIVDFYASWCGPCKSIAPILEELADEYDGQVYIYKVDTDKEQELSSAFGITSIPTLLFIPMAGKPRVVQGALPKTELKRLIDDVLLKNK